MGKTIDEAPETLRTAILTLQDKIQDNEAEFRSAPLTIEVRMGDGRYVDRVNPLVQEYRAMVRDFSAACKAYKEIMNGSESSNIKNLDDIRARFKVAK